MKLKAILFLAFSAFVFSCNKDDDDSINDYLTGSWQLVQVGADTNNNQIMEPAELLTLPDSGIITTVFNRDGSGHGSFNLNPTFSINAKFHWSVDNSQQILSVHTEDSMVYNMDIRITDNRNFYLLNNDASLFGHKLWLVYNRQ